MLALYREHALSPVDRVRIHALSTAVYPPGPPRASAAVHWAPCDIHVLNFSGEELVAHVGGLVRDCRRDGGSLRVGGVGGVMTAPAARNRGRARAAIERMQQHLVVGERVHFMMLFCAPRLHDFYGKLGWRPFGGAPIVEQHGARVAFTYNSPMVHDGIAAAPDSGALDLLGPPW